MPVQRVPCPSDDNVIIPSKHDLNSDTYLISDKRNHVIIRLALKIFYPLHVFTNLRIVDILVSLVVVGRGRWVADSKLLS